MNIDILKQLLINDNGFSLIHNNENEITFNKYISISTPPQIIIINNEKRVINGKTGKLLLSINIVKGGIGEIVQDEIVIPMIQLFMSIKFKDIELLSDCIAMDENSDVQDVIKELSNFFNYF